MDSHPRTAVDPPALWAAALRLDAAADALHTALGTYLRALHLDTPPGVRSAVQGLVADVDRWQQTARETAAALRTAAARFTHGETQAAEALR